MGLSSRSFLLSDDDALHALVSTAYMRMLRQEEVAHVPDFAGQRVRQASVILELVDRTPIRIMRRTFSILEFDADGLLNVARLCTQQFARMDDSFIPARSVPVGGARIVDATRRFVAQGGSWEPDERLLLRIEAVALAQLPCQRVRVVR